MRGRFTSAQMDVIIVHHHAPEMARDSVEALRVDARTAEIELHVVIADNGSTPDERGVLRSIGVDYLDIGTNAGYAGAVNAAFAATKFPFIALMNEDVLVRPGCLRALCNALASGAAAAGPDFYWDLDMVLRLPCTEERTRRAELLRIGGRHSLSNLQRARGAWREHARRHWRAVEPFPTTSLSGAMIAFRRDAWEAVGPLDSGFQLYFEENDWLRRLSMAGLLSLYVPAAKAIHLHNPRLASTAERLQMESESFLRFGNRYYGETFMQRLIAISQRETAVPVWQPFTGEVDLPGEAALPLSIEFTVSPFGFPAAAMVVEGAARSWSLPPMRGLDFLNGPLFLQVVDDSGRELGGYCVHRTRSGDERASRTSRSAVTA